MTTDSFPYDGRDVSYNLYFAPQSTLNIASELLHEAGDQYMVARKQAKKGFTFCTYPDKTTYVEIQNMDLTPFIFLSTKSGYPLLFPNTTIPVLNPGFVYTKNGDTWAIMNHAFEEKWLVDRKDFERFNKNNKKVQAAGHDTKFVVDRQSKFPLINANFRFNESTYNFEMADNDSTHSDIHIKKGGGAKGLNTTETHTLQSIQMYQDLIRPNHYNCVKMVLHGNFYFLYSTDCISYDGVSYKDTTPNQWGFKTKVMDYTTPNAHIATKSDIDDALSQFFVNKYMDKIQIFVDNLNKELQQKFGNQSMVFTHGGAAFTQLYEESLAYAASNADPNLTSKMNSFFESNNFGELLKSTSTIRDVDLYMYIPDMQPCKDFKECYYRDGVNEFTCMYDHLKKIRNVIHNDVYRNHNKIIDEMNKLQHGQGHDFFNSTNTEITFLRNEEGEIEEPKKTVVVRPDKLFRNLAMRECDDKNMKVQAEGGNKLTRAKGCFPLFTSANFTIEYDIGKDIHCKFILIRLVMNIQHNEILHRVKFIDISIPFAGDTLVVNANVKNLVKSVESFSEKQYGKLGFLLYFATVRTKSLQEQLQVLIGDMNIGTATALDMINGSVPGNGVNNAILEKARCVNKKLGILNARYAYMIMLLRATPVPVGMVGRGRDQGSTLASMRLPQSMMLPQSPEQYATLMKTAKAFSRAMQEENTNKNAKPKTQYGNFFPGESSSMQVATGKMVTKAKTKSSELYAIMRTNTESLFTYMLGQTKDVKIMTQYSMEIIENFLKSQSNDDKMAYLTLYKDMLKPKA